MRANEIEVCGGCYRIVQVKTMTDTTEGVQICQKCVALNEHEAAIAREEAEANEASLKEEAPTLDAQVAAEYAANQDAFEARFA